MSTGAGAGLPGFMLDRMVTLDVNLRAVRDEDIPVFYEQQLDPVATEMAAFPPREWPEFETHWRRVRRDESNVTRTIVVNGEVAGNIGSFVLDDQRLVGYWLGRTYWGQGIATGAIHAFLREVVNRPLLAHVAEHNTGSRRVLEKNGFQLISQHRSASTGSLPEIVELLFQLG